MAPHGDGGTITARCRATVVSRYVTRETKNMSLRLDPDLAEELEIVASMGGRTVSDVIREALRAHVDATMRDPEFQRLLEENISRHQRILRSLRDRERPPRKGSRA